jgi:hypothetical protein
MEPDYDGDFWADTEEKTHGPIDTEENRKEFPEGFIWQCCEKTGDKEGCEIGKHMPDLAKRAKLRA